jgi:hypothetical protein
MGIQEIETTKFSQKLKEFCTRLNTWLMIIVALMLINGYLIGLLIWWETYDA